MLDELTDQLRRYGDGVERHLLDANADVAIARQPRQHRLLLAAVAAAVVLAAGAFLVTLDGPDSTEVATGGQRLAPPDASAPTASQGSTLSGIATWLARPDERAELRVAACPAADTSVGCESVRSVAVAADGSFALTLPPASGEWIVAAYVPATTPACVFNCAFPKRPRNAIVGPAQRVSIASLQPLGLSVSARVVDVSVRDRAGRPFAGGGVQVTDSRCSASDCVGDLVPMFVRASDPAGAVRLVLDPAATYEIHGQATNTGWPDPAWTNDGNTFWFSPSIMTTGSELQDGYVFRVDGSAEGSG